MATIYNLYAVDRLVEKKRIAQYGNRELEDPDRHFGKNQKIVKELRRAQPTPHQNRGHQQVPIQQQHLYTNPTCEPRRENFASQRQEVSIRNASFNIQITVEPNQPPTFYTSKQVGAHNQMQPLTAQWNREEYAARGAIPKRPWKAAPAYYPQQYAAPNYSAYIIIRHSEVVKTSECTFKLHNK